MNGAAITNQELGGEPACLPDPVPDSNLSSAHTSDAEAGPSSEIVENEVTVSKPMPPTRIEVLVTMIFTLAVMYAALFAIQMLRSPQGFSTGNPLFLGFALWLGTAGFFALTDYE